jgi:SprT protein
MLNNDIEIPNHFQHKTQSMMEQFFALASAFYKTSFALPDLVFFHRGTAAGKANYSSHTLALNYPLLQREGTSALNTTVGHEVAHFIVHALYGRKAQAHGKEWRYVMQDVLGLPAERTHQFAVADLKSRTLQTFAYKCDCMKHTFTSIRHNRVQSGKQEYRCKKCRNKLVYEG